MLNKLTAVFIVFFCVFSSYSQEKSDRENSDLKGYVKSVKEETAEIIFKNGKSKETNRELDTIETLDISGKQKTYYVYTDGKEILYGDTNFYDSQGKLVERKTEHSPYLNLCDKKTFIYNENGQLSEELCYGSNGKIKGKYIYNYNLDGKLIEQKSIPNEEKSKYFNDYATQYEYDENGRQIEIKTIKQINGEWQPEDFRIGYYKRKLFYNSQDQIAVEMQIGSDEKLFRLNNRYYDENGNEIESINYNADGTVKEKNRYEYQYDKYGNYIKEIDYEWTTEDGKSFYQPSEVTYRKIEYFSEKEIKEFEAKNQNSNKSQENQVLQNTDKEEYEVYKTLLEQWIVNQEIKNLVVKRFTDTHSVGDEKKLTANSFQRFGSETSLIEQSIVDDYNQKNYRRSSQLLENNFGENSKVVLIKDSELNEIFAESCNEGWKKLHEKYPNSQGLTTLSRVGFNEDKTKAVVYLGHSFACLGGAGHLIILQKTSEDWKIVEDQILWIS